MAKTRLVKNKKGEYGVYDPYTDQVTPVSGMDLVKNTRGKYGFKSGNGIIPLDELPTTFDLEKTFKKKVDTALSSATSSTDSTSEFKPAGTPEPIIEEDPKKKAEAKQAEKQAENQRYIDMFGLGRLDYSGLQKFGSLGEIAADVLDVPANLSKAFIRGTSNGRISQAITDYAKDGEAMDSDLIARLIKENSTKTGSTYLKTLQEKGILQADDLSAAGGLAEIVMESLGSMAGAIKGGFQGAALGAGAGLATGAVAGAVGGPIGSAIAGAVSTAGGAMSGFAGFTSYVNEYGSSIQQSLANKGYDLTDAKQVEKGLKDKSVMDEAKEKANTRGLTVGMFDALTAGVAGKGASIAVKMAERSAIQAGKQITKAGARRVAGSVALGIESTMGSIGEAMGQLAAEGKIKDYDAVALEFIAELGPAGPTAAYAMYKAGQINSDLNQDNLKKIDALKKTSEVLTEDDAASKKAIETKISNLEKENKNRNKSMTNALQVAPVSATKRVLELTDAITDLESTIDALKSGDRTDIDAESRKAIFDSLDDMIAEREEIRQEMLQAAKTEEQNNLVPSAPIKPVVFIGENADKVTPNNATELSRNQPLMVSSTGTPITFSEKFNDKESARAATAFKVTQGENNFGTIIEHEVGGEKQFTLAETGKKYATADDAKFALQEKLTGERVSELDRVGIDRIKVEGNLGNKEIFVGNKENNNQLDAESKGAIQRAVRALRSVSNANVYLYSNNDDYAKGLANASGADVGNVNTNTNAQVVNAEGQNSIHINLEKAGISTISHEVFHGALLGLAKKDPNAFVTMRDSILNRISDKKSLTITDDSGGKRKVSAKEYLDDFQKRYSGQEYTEADRAEEFLSELAGLMSLENNDVVKDKSLLDSIKLTIKDVLKKFNVEFDSLNELQETEDMLQFFKDFNRSIKTGEVINLSKVEGVTPAEAAAQPVATQPIAQAQATAGFKKMPDGTMESKPMRVKGRDKTMYMKMTVLKNGESIVVPLYKPQENSEFYVENKGSLAPINAFNEKVSSAWLSPDEFYSSYGVDIKEIIDKQNSKITPKYKNLGAKVDGLTISAEVTKPDGTKQVLIQFSVNNKGPKKKGAVQYYPEEFIDVPKLRYTDDFTGITTTQPESEPAQARAQDKPKGQEAKQPINDVISTATDKAIEVKKKEKAKPVGNRKPKKDRFVRMDLINDALAVEPTSPTDLALQYFIRGGAVLRGRIQDDKKNPVNPAPHSLVTLFAKKVNQMYRADNSEMGKRFGLTDSDAPNITGIAQILYESKANEQLEFDTSDLRNAVEEVLMGHISRASMAKAIIADKGTLSQQNILDGDQMLASMNEADALATKYYADKAGVTTEEFLKDPSKYMDEDEMVDGYQDMQTAFDILDEIQDEEVIKKYLEISSPEDLFLDELTEEAIKPEKTLETQKAELIAEQKASKAEIATINKALTKMSSEGQISLVEPTQVKMYATDTLPAMQKKKALETKLESIKDSITKIDAAIEFKARKTIDVFEGIVEQKAEEVSVESVMPQAESFFIKKPNSRAMVIDVEKIKNEKPAAYDYIKKFKGHENFEISDVKNLLITSYSTMMRYKAGAENLLASISQIEDIVDLSNATNTRTKEQFKSEIKDSGDFSDAELSIVNEAVDSLNTDFMPEYNSNKESLKLAGINADKTLNFYALSKNILRAKNPRTIIHEIGHFAFYNILSKQDRLEFLKGMIESTYGAKGKSLSSRIAMASEKAQYEDDTTRYTFSTNVANDFAEYFAEQFNQWYVGKKLTPTQFDTMFAKVEEFLQKLINKLKSGEYIDKSLIKYFEKISNAKEATRAEPVAPVTEKKAPVATLTKEEIEWAGIQKKDDIAALENKLYWAGLALEDKSTGDNQRQQIEKNIASYRKAIAIKKSESTISKDGGQYSFVQIRIAEGVKSDEVLYAELQNAEKRLNERYDNLAMQEQYPPKEKSGPFYKAHKAGTDRLLSEISRLKIESEDIALAIGLRQKRAEIATAKAEPIVVEPAKAQPSKNDKRIKELEGEIEAYESEIENAQEEIENSKYNYKEDVAALKQKKADIRAQKMSRDEREEELDSIDAEIEEAADVRDTYIEQYKDTISEAKGEIRKLQKKLDKLKVTTKSQLSGEQVSPFKRADPTYKYQMSGTEASLKLVDKIRTKYNMQHTAEEMGMVGKGIRATEKIITDNVITRVFGGANAAIYKRFANNRANKLIGKPFAMLQDLIATNVKNGLSSQNAAAARASAYSVAMIQNLGSTEDFQFARNKLTGGKSVAKNELWQLGKELNEMINQDKVALKRVHSLLDPEAFEDVSDPTLPNDKFDLSFAELRLYNVLRDMNDFIHEWHYEHGFLGEGEAADALYEMNKGSYFPRMYNEIENKKFEDLYDALAKLPNAADFTMFKERKDFADVKESFTLKTDPIYITTKRFGQMMQNQAILQFCDYVSKSNDYKIYSKKDQIPEGALKAGNYRQLPYGKNGGKRYGELTGKFVPDIVAQQLMGVEFSNQIINLTYQAAKVFDKSFARQVLSKAKTTWNPLTRAGNITMNFVFASLMGIDPITLLKNRVAAKESIDAYDADTRELDANGLLGVSMGRDLQDVDEKDAKEALSAAADKVSAMVGNATGLKMRKPKAGQEPAPEVPKGKGRILADKVVSAAKELDQALTDSYGRADDVAKVAAFKSLVYDYGKSRDEAIRIIGSGMQNYNTVGKAYDYASKSVNRFVKFKADSARIIYNTFKERPLNLMATLGMLMAAQALASKISGEDEEERKIREERPYTNKIKLGPVTISLTMKFGDSEINVARYLAPYSMYDAGYDSNTLKDVSTYLPFQYDPNTVIAVNDPLIGPIINLATDKDFRGMCISDPNKNAFISKTVTDQEALWNRIAFAGRNYGAPYWGWVENINAAATGNQDYYGRSRTLTDALLNTVIKVQKVDNATLQKTYEGVLRKLDGDVQNIEKTVSYKASIMDVNISKKYEQEGVTQSQIDKYVAEQERMLVSFTEEQQAEIDKKYIDLEKNEQTLMKLQQIAQRKQNKK